MRGFLLLLSLVIHVALAQGGEFVRFEENGKVGLKDGQGNIVIPASFEALGWSDGQFSVIGQITGYKLGERWGLINLQKKFITPADYETLTYSGGDRMIASKKINSFTMKYGCVDLSGHWVVPFRYDGIMISGLRAVVFTKNGLRYEFGVIDLNDNTIIPRQYRSISPIGTLRYAVENDSAKIALFSDQGAQLTRFVIDSIGTFRKGFAVVYQAFAKGLIDRNGDFKVKAEFRDVEVDENGTISVREFEEWKLLDRENHIVHRVLADQLDFLNDGLYRITIAGRSGLLDQNLQPLLAPQFEYIGESDHGHRVVRNGQKKYGVINMDFSHLIPLAFDTLVLKDNFIRAARNSNAQRTWVLFDTFGVQKTSHYYEQFEPFNGHFFPVRKYGYWGAVNRYGEEFLNCVFDSITDSRDGLIAVRFKGQYGILDEREKWLVAAQPNKLRLVNNHLYLEEDQGNTFLKNFDGETVYFSPYRLKVMSNYLVETAPDEGEKLIGFDGMMLTPEPVPVTIAVDRTFTESEGMRGFVKDGKYGFLDARGRLRIANRYDDIGEFHEGLAPFKLIGKWGYVSTSDNIVVNPNYDVVSSFSHGVAEVYRSNKGGLIDSEGKLLLPVRYDSIVRLPDQSFLLKLNGLYGLADSKGNVLIETRFNLLETLPNGLVRVEQQGKYALLTRDGMSVVPMVYDQLLYDAGRDRFVVWKKTSWHRALLD